MADRYYKHNTGYWGDTANWSTTSGGSPGASVPTINDDVYFDSNSFYTGFSHVVISGASYCKNFNFSPAAPQYLHGELNVAGNFVANNNARLNDCNCTMYGIVPPSSPATFNNASLYPVKIFRIWSSIGGRVELASTLLSSGIQLIGGYFNTKGFGVTSGYMNVQSKTGTYINIDGSTITLTNRFDLDYVEGFSAVSSTIIITGYGAVIDGYGQTFEDIDIRNYCYISGSNIFKDIKLMAGKTLTVQAGTTQTITSLTGDGTKAEPIMLKSNSGGSYFTLSQSSGTVDVDRYIIQDCKATGGAVFTATNSKATGITSGWNIIGPQAKITYKSATFTYTDIVEGKCNTQHALTGESLAYDTLDFTIWSENEIEFTQGEPLGFFFNEELINKFYLLDIKRVGKKLYQFSCVSAIGLLDMSMHYGGIYSGTLLTDVLVEILDGITYDVDPLVSGIRLYGWLPYDTKRNNLQQITIGTALSLKIDSSGTLIIGSSSADAVGRFGKDRCSLTGRVDKLTACTAVQVTEHYYSQSTETIVLFDDTFTTEEIILFQEPVHDLAITGGTIISSSANHAIVQGSGAVYLTGEKYIHNTRLITKGTIVGDASDHIVTVSNSTLVTFLNSNSVAERIYNAYNYPSEIKTDVLFGDERSGDVVEIINPYTDVVETAFTKRMDIQLGSFLKASADYLVDYVPEGAVTNYANREILTTDQTWIVPEGVEKIRAIVCGGGDGGKAGTSGTAGQVGSAPYYDGGYKPPDYARGEGGKGGTAGSLGEGGKVLFTDEISVTELQEFAVVIGTAGTGGSTEGASGTAGGDTTFGSYSSADGTKRKYGFTDIGSGILLGVYGKEGTGGADGKGDENPFNGRAGDMIGFDSTLYIGGEPGKVHDGTFAYAYGGGGSGATGNSNGGKGTNGSGDNYRSYGGAGAAGIKGKDGDNATLYGGGGDAGNGGSGGGGGGSAAGPYGNVNTPGAGGAAGTFGKGGNGKAGCVIIYY